MQIKEIQVLLLSEWAGKRENSAGSPQNPFRIVATSEELSVQVPAARSLLFCLLHQGAEIKKGHLTCERAKADFHKFAAASDQRCLEPTFSPWPGGFDERPPPWTLLGGLVVHVPCGWWIRGGRSKGNDVVQRKPGYPSTSRPAYQVVSHPGWFPPKRLDAEAVPATNENHNKALSLDGFAQVLAQSTGIHKQGLLIIRC